MDKFNRIKLFIYENKKRIIMGGCLVFIFLLLTVVFLKKDSFKTDKIEYENLLEEKVETEILDVKKDVEEIEYFFVDVKGSVNNPGVYSLEKGKRVVDAINKAGGLKKDASTNLLNLSMEILDEMVIVVYSSNEINNLKEVKEEEIKTEVICTETIINDACICNNDTMVNGTGEDIKGESNENEVEDTSGDKKEDVSKELVNINSAKLEVLMTLPSIGESKAKAIIEYREQNGPFKKIDDIKNVSGIGDKLFESIKDFITV